MGSSSIAHAAVCSVVVAASDQINSGLHDMPTSDRIKDFVEAVKRWAVSRPEIHAVALVGSYARGNARATSDIDLVILLDDPRCYLEETSWLQDLGTPERTQLEDYGLVTSLRVWFQDGKEVEFGLTTPVWISSPLDEGTLRTMRDGMQVLFEREPILSPLLRM